ncbi:GNAT family N-acetyltransferase [Psychromarinibacter sp. C21-152]|uniref:GNAT family N-acetyltransferase n=1 Tax=Psychromarinibacter sediminicola TaxID=3033385 RepID=A0AAE3NU87_9RHOB|nr:GNAT family N-acetyltransferase [Psychromarinibacter sediminicola]MDF0601769.1 GNAT family N-acetyltransferase [Psychromarinibacter sediminicola]
MSGTAVHIPTLHTERLILRAPEPRDCPAWEAFLCSDRGRFVGGGPETTPGRAWRAFASITGHWALRGCGIFVVTRRDTGAPIGSCGPWFPGDWPEREIAWSVWDAAHEGHGYMAEAARAVLAHAFGPLGWDTAVSYIAPDNARSRALAERLGAIPDPDAALPPGDGDTLVFRHRAPETDSDAAGGMEAYA